MVLANLSSIMNKVEQCTKKENVQKQIAKITDERMTGAQGKSANGKMIKSAVQAADKFIEVLKQEINNLAGEGYANGRLGSTAIQALTQLKHGPVQKVGKNQYKIDIWFEGNLSRESLDPTAFDGIENIVALLNNGYKDGGKSMTSNPVYGVWLNHYGNQWIPSLRQRQGAHFIDNAIRNFMSGFAQEYGVINIETDDAYK